MELKEAVYRGEGSLADRIRSGDAGAFEEVFRAHFDGLCGYVWRYVKDSDIARDMVQNVMVNLWQRREHLFIQESMSSYLYRAVRNEALNYLKHEAVVRRWQTECPAAEEPVTPEEELAGQTLAHRLEKAIGQLPERRREIFLLSRQHGLTYRQIADLLGISPTTVETQIARALLALRAVVAVAFVCLTWP